jgi:hypothetical protein
MTISSVKTGAIGDSLLAGNAAYDPGAFVSLATFSLASNTATVTFSSIPSTYQHLQVRINSRCTRAAANGNLNIQLNSDTGANYTYHELAGDGATTLVGGATAQTAPSISRSPGTTTNADVFAGTIIDIHDYASTTKNKVLRSFYGYDNNSATVIGNVGMRSILWLNTAAITTLTFTSASSSSFTSGSVFSLYGIKGA